MPRPSRAFLCVALAAGVAFVASADDFPKPYDSGKPVGSPQPPAEAAAGFRLPVGFKVGVFAAEPDVRNPIGLAWDARGRLFVAENYTYAEREKKFDLSLRDRVVVFTDADGDGKPESRTVFLDTVQRLTSVEVGRGGVWLMCPPQLLFVPDRDGDLKPDGPPEVVLDGFDVPAENYHNFANGLKFGPDGWLYGRCGASAPGNVRRADAGPETAVPLAGGVWRYHPATRAFEVLSHGTTNPWGHDWDARGEAFFVNSVNGHLWHLIPGAHYRRPHTVSPNPLVYAPMEMHADHWHFDTGKDWTASRDQKTSSDLGGGHAHSGAMIYQAEQWPAFYRNKLLTLNLHGRRANVERLERQGSGFVARRDPDTLSASDPFFRGIDLSTGPDGGVFVLDWSDAGECHEHDGVHRNSGRVYKVTYGDVKPSPAPDLTRLSDTHLAELQALGGEWHARAARRELADRKASGKDVTAVRESLVTLLHPGAKSLDTWAAYTLHPLGGGIAASGDVALVRPDSPQRLRALWTLHALGLTNPDMLARLLADANESVRAWAVRLLVDAWPLDTVTGESRAEGVAVPPGLVDRFARLARDEVSGLVRLALASALQRLPVKDRPALAAALLARADDAADPNLPPLVWYGLIPVVRKDPNAVVPLAAAGKFPQVRQWAARRFAEVMTTDPTPVDALLAATKGKDESARRDVVAGLTAGLAGTRKAAPPAAWKDYPKGFPDAPTRAAVQAVEVVFGDGRALDEVRRVALDGKADLETRKAALRALVAARPADLRAVCEKLLGTRFLNAVALGGLVQSNDPAVGKLIAKSVRAFHPVDRPAVVDALSSRPEFAADLLDLVAAGAVPRAELTAAHARQIRGFNRPELTKKLADVWGEVRDTPADKAKLMQHLRADLTPAALAAASKPRGRAVFAASCAACHRLFGAGNDIGPDLTGAGRKDLEYLLSNVADPSAVVTKDFQVTILSLIDGRTVTGFVLAETPQALTLQTAQARVAVPKADIDARVQSTQSLMPDGLLQTLTPQQVRDLFAYLQGETQVELPAGQGKP